MASATSWKARARLLPASKLSVVPSVNTNRTAGSADPPWGAGVANAGVAGAAVTGAATGVGIGAGRSATGGRAGVNHWAAGPRPADCPGGPEEPPRRAWGERRRRQGQRSTACYAWTAVDSNESTTA